MEFFIPGNVPSKKNGLCFKCVNGKPMKYPAKKMTEYKKLTSEHWKKYKKQFIECLEKLNVDPPYDIGFYFARSTKTKFDYIGPLETVQDYMVDFGWLEDDNMDIIKPHILGHEVNKKKPGVVIKII